MMFFTFHIHYIAYGVQLNVYHLVLCIEMVATRETRDELNSWSFIKTQMQNQGNTGARNSFALLALCSQVFVLGKIVECKKLETWSK